MKNWKLPNLTKDQQSITSDWDMLNQKLIEGVELKEVKSVMKDNGILTEVFRKEWFSEFQDVDQIFQIRMNPGAISGWHAHESTWDRIFVNLGTIKVVLYDSRQSSPTYGMINEFRLSEFRSGIVTIPPKVFHAVFNVAGKESALLNIVDVAYKYTDPDHWRIPIDDPSIPYKF